MTTDPEVTVAPGPADGVYALLTDGTTVMIAPARPQDTGAVRQMHAQMSPDNIYLRFFSISPAAADREAKRVTRPPDADHCALLAWLGDELVGVASYEPTGKPGVAEIAFAVTDHMHGRGVATLLLDHLVSNARLRGLRAFTAETLAGNVAMLRVFANAGFAGRVYALNPHAKSVLGVACVPSVADLPEPPDIAVVAVPAAHVNAVAQDCGRRGAKSLVVVTAGIDADSGAELLATCRRHGMRLVGPNCFGVAIPPLGLNATFANAEPPPGSAGLVVQSGGIGIAVLEHLTRLGIGVSSFASVGDKYDLSSNDMLMWWEQDN